jgi:uridine kinase
MFSDVFALIAAIDRPAIVAIDGHSASGKTTLASHVVDATPGASVVHTDDIAWYHSVFDWVDLLVDGVLAPWRAAHAVDYRPPKWDERDRAGSITVPAGTNLLIVEGVGSSRRALRPHIDAAIWVETPEPIRLERDRQRIAAGETTQANYDTWMLEEMPFIADDRPWERADVIVRS